LALLRARHFPRNPKIFRHVWGEAYVRRFHIETGRHSKDIYLFSTNEFDRNKQAPQY
jgi:hypothetical protein